MLWIIYVLFAIAQPVSADITFPTSTRVYFEQNGAAVNTPVDFKISCYGYSWAPGPEQVPVPGSYEPSEVYSFSAECPSYGCTIDEEYYLNYRHIDFCMLAATVDGHTALTNIGNQPYTECNNDFQQVQSCTSYFDLTDTYQSHPVHNRSFWLALLLTMLVESVVLLIALKGVLRKRIQPTVSWLMVAGLGIGLSGVTLPYLWFVLPNLPYVSSLIPGWYIWSVYLGEVLVILVEAALLRKWVGISKQAALVISIIANIISFAVGLVLMYWY